MKQILHLKAEILDVDCRRELGWLQLRLLVLNLLNTMVPLSSQKKLSVVYIKDLQSVYRQYLQIPFSSFDDSTLCLSVKNEVIRQLNELEERIAAAA